MLSQTSFHAGGDPENPVSDAVGKVLRDFADPQAIIKASSGSWKLTLWDALAGLGLPGIWASEASGGLGLALADSLDIAALLGRHAVAVPIAETMIANWVLAAAGLPSDAAPMVTCILSPAGGPVHAWRSVPTLFALEASHVVLVAADGTGSRVAKVAVSAVDVRAVESVAGDACGVVSVRDASAVEWTRATELAPQHILLLGATVRSLQIAGALEAILTMSLDYAQQRVAFGKTISKFQAVQQRMAQLGGEVAAAIAVSHSAADALAGATDTADPAVLLEVASAKIRCGEAAEAGCAIAHQIHGAIGFAAEHPLHRYTLRALGWRDDFGDEATWAKSLGTLVTGGPPMSLWPLLAAQ